MAINIQELHDILFDNLRNYSESDAYKNDRENPQHMMVMAETMRTYFEEKMVITYGWGATNPSSGATDPARFFESTVRFSTWNLSRPMTLGGLATRIIASVSAGVINHPLAFSVTPGSFFIRPLVLPQHNIADECLMRCIVAPICNWIKTLVNPAPLSGTHGVFAGATTSMVIT